MTSSSLARKFDNTQLAFNANRTKISKGERVLENVINLSKDLQLIHDDRKIKFMKRRKRVKTIF